MRLGSVTLEPTFLIAIDLGYFTSDYVSGSCLLLEFSSPTQFYKIIKT